MNRELQEVGAYEAKTHLPKLLARVEQGERITITKHGRAVAMLIPAETRNREAIGRTIDEIKKSRASRSLKDIDIKVLINEGRP